MHVRAANLHDAEPISNLMHQLGYEATPELLSSKLEAFDADPLEQVFVALSDERLVGVVSCHVTSLFHEAGSLGRITSFVVDEDFRGAGVGRSLLAAAEEFFIGAGCIRSEVTSADHRSDAHEFYKACGYIEHERRFVKAYT